MRKSPGSYVVSCLINEPTVHFSDKPINNSNEKAHVYKQEQIQLCIFGISEVTVKNRRDGSGLALTNEATPQVKNKYIKNPNMINCNSMLDPEGGARTIHKELPFSLSPEAPHNETKAALSYTCSEDVILHHEYLKAQRMVLLNCLILTCLN